MPLKLRTGDKIVGGFLLTFATAAMAVTAFVPKPEPVIDDERSSYLQAQFSGAINTAIKRPGFTAYTVPANIKDAGATLQTYHTERTAIEENRNGGDRSATLRNREAQNNMLLQNAEGTFMTHGGTATFIGTLCKATDGTRKYARKYDCSLVVAELGGVDDELNNVKACTKLQYSFNVNVNDDGTFTVENYYAPNTKAVTLSTALLDGTAEAYPGTFMEENVNPGTALFSKLNETELNAGQALLQFGKCLPTVN